MTHARTIFVKIILSLGVSLIVIKVVVNQVIFDFSINKRYYCLRGFFFCLTRHGD